MKINVYSVHDAANGYVNPQLFPNDYAAQRSFAHAIERDPGISAFPVDFTLWYIGTFDTDTGELFDDIHRRIMCATDVLPKKNNEVKENE